MTKKERMTELVEILNAALLAYEQFVPYMTDHEYDKLYDELLDLEVELGVVSEASPSRRVGHEVVSSLKKAAHDRPLLSLNKTKHRRQMREFLNRKELGDIFNFEPDGILSWKLDGLTIVVKYRDGALQQALTRGNGEIGEDVTHNAKFFVNLPNNIDFLGEIAVRGEAIISFEEFERINEASAEGAKFKNPRNLTAGTIRQLSSHSTQRRRVQFYAFELLYGYDLDCKAAELELLEGLGFETVEYRLCTHASIVNDIKYFEDKLPYCGFATDGLVLTYNNRALSEALGATSKFPKDSLAFKWTDEQETTTLTDILWNTSRTGLINPIAIFEPVELAGTTVSRASLHNLSIVEELKLGIGDSIVVYKANMIIPQVLKNLSEGGEVVSPPAHCPVCKGDAVIKEDNGIKTLHCVNYHCEARLVARIAHYAGRDALNIEGFSVQTIEKFMNLGFLHNYTDIYSIAEHKDVILSKKGFGKRSFEKLIAAIEQSKTVSQASFVYGLGIDHVGLANAKLLCRHFDYDMATIRQADIDDLEAIEGFGAAIAQSLHAFFADEQNGKLLDIALTHLTFKQEEAPIQAELSGLSFVITGSLNAYASRKALAEEVERAGGKVLSSVSKNASYLINNDIHSNSSKNKKAKELGIPIITEEDFMKLLGQL